MKCLGKQINITYSNYFGIVTIISTVLLVFAFVFNMSFVHQNVKKINENQEKMEVLLKNIQNQPAETVKQQSISINKDFISDYYVIQADWLNKWLTILAIIIGIFGVMIPICFVKFLENKEKEMDRIIKDAIKQKKKTKLNVEQMENQLKEVNQQAKIMNEQLQEVNKKAETMDEQLQEVKGYVYETQALSKCMEGEQKYKDKQYEEAKELLEASLKLNSNSDKTHYLLGATYLKLKNYDEAKTHLLKAIEIKPSSTYYDFLSQIAWKDENYLEAVNLHKKAYDIASSNFIKAYCLSRIATDYSRMGDINHTNEYIKKSLTTNNSIIAKSNCASALVNLKENKRAIEMLKGLIQYGNVVDLYNLVEAYIMDEQFENALETLKKYIQSERKTIEGIYKDDYENWRSKLMPFSNDVYVQQILQIINSLKKEDRY